jgi:hypothetical protein
LEASDFAEGGDEHGRRDDEFDTGVARSISDEGKAGEVGGGDQMGITLGEPDGKRVEGEARREERDMAVDAAVFKEDGDDAAGRLPETTGADRHARLHDARRLAVITCV